MVPSLVGKLVMVKALAPGLKAIPLTSKLAMTDTAELFETANVAVSAGPLGTVAGVQFEAMPQLLLPGFRFHVALPAWALMAKARMRMMRSFVFIGVAGLGLS